MSSCYSAAQYQTKLVSNQVYQFMKKRILGGGGYLKDRLGVQVSSVGLGCMSMTPVYGKTVPEDGIETIHYAVERGVNFLDTSDSYGDGRNEELVGRAIRNLRNRIVVATKFGNVNLPDGRRIVNGRPEYVAKACENSLKRLGIEYIDLYYLHRVDLEVPIEDTVGAMGNLVKAGKIRHIGLSEAGAETIRRAHAETPLTALQTEYSLFSRGIEEEILPTCRELGIGVVSYAPLSRGLLSGTIKDQRKLEDGDRRRSMPRYSPENFSANLKLVEPVEKLAKEMSITPAQVAIGWVLSQGQDIVAIAGTAKIEHLDENISTCEIEFDPESLSELTRLIKQSDVQGERYPATLSKWLDA